MHYVITASSHLGGPGHSPREPYLRLKCAPPVSAFRAASIWLIDAYLNRQYLRYEVWVGKVRGRKERLGVLVEATKYLR